MRIFHVGDRDRCILHSIVYYGVNIHRYRVLGQHLLWWNIVGSNTQIDLDLNGIKFVRIK